MQPPLTWGDRRPVEPPPSEWALPSPLLADVNGLVGVGADLEPGTLLAAYRSGLFPMPVGRRRLGWFSPDPRGIIPLDRLRITRSLRQSARRYGVRVDTAFRTVIEACGRPERPQGWITPAFMDAYGRLHELGWAHSIEIVDDSGTLVGGLYGVKIGALFAGESMFHDRRDTSKVALMALVELMKATGMSLLDIQWTTPHLVSLGAVDVPRREYLERLASAVR
jgi:leucyl/phenylalanyl-tRNA--protein transferase